MCLCLCGKIKIFVYYIIVPRVHTHMCSLKFFVPGLLLYQACHAILLCYTLHHYLSSIQDYLRAMELFQKGVDKGSPEAHLYIGMGYLCMYNVHVIYTERERERREEGVHTHIYMYILTLFSSRWTW